MSKKAYIYFTPEELDKKFEDALVQVKEHVSVYNRKTKKQITNIIIPGNKNILEKALYHTPRPVGILMHPNGNYAFVSNFTAGRVEVIDMHNFSIVSSIRVGNMPDGLALIH